MEVGCSSCLDKSTCDYVVWGREILADGEKGEKILMPDPDAIVGECPYYRMDQSPLMTAETRQAAVQRMAEIAKGSYSDHLMVQAYMRIAHVDVPVYARGDCENCEDSYDDCDLDPDECVSDGEPVGTEPGEFTKFVINIQTKDKLTDQEGVVRMQEIQGALKQFNDDEVRVENCVFEINFVHVQPAPIIEKMQVPDTLPGDL
jgi:hypothetical protein